ncbi:hypothetical protein NKR23_g8387 [Pleurostoma richardsiae]|uniref:Cnl2/NKP2 family protein n=1 Tax=Pleurostoma richardsiae TaxID=41990 RepID=A0AA38R863_9PEZI|nr:hypothetical protein NKR23_g8387 [Pleurostoma richardsiae]
MAPTESTILEHYLLTPSQLPSIVSLKEFTELFPRALQSSPHIRTLYRDLQNQRNEVADSVKANIEAEVKRGKTLRREVVKARREEEGHEVDNEVEIERVLYGSGAGNHGPKHDLASTVLELENAAEDLDTEVQNLEDEEAQLRQSLQRIVGTMSDLRYGRLANPQLQEQVLEGLQNVKEICERNS